MKSSLFIASVLVLASISGCASNDDDGSSASGGSGAAGSGAGGGASAHCKSHEDCGCPSGTTNQDIADGVCGFACTTDDCARVCDSDGDCTGTTKCNSNGVYGTCR
ncbi:MAG TPA: hypothetical protein VGP93_15145 [Polyangiaceae bacterium]|nr:hypothetical protein [Polyangiaceae bacterium]